MHESRDDQRKKLAFLKLKYYFSKPQELRNNILRRIENIFK
jgi:hypothetical protein